MQERVEPSVVIAIAVANPLEVFRTAALLLFDPDLILLGPSAFVILDAFGRTGYLVWGFAYPATLGTALAFLGYRLFRRSDLPY